MKKLFSIAAPLFLWALLVLPAHALEYSFDAPADYLFARPTGDSTVYQWENPNVDRSKNTALIPPGFGMPTSYLDCFGDAPSQQAGAVVSGNTAATAPPDIALPIAPSIGCTEVTPDLYYSNGSLGTLKIPSIGLTVGVYEGTDSAALLKGAGHFEGTSIWDGNVALAAHNRGVRNDFGKIHTLKSGDVITLTTALGTRRYAVSSVMKVSVNDTSGLNPTAENCVTLYTCVEDQPAYRWCVKAAEIV